MTAVGVLAGLVMLTRMALWESHRVTLTHVERGFLSPRTWVDFRSTSKLIDLELFLVSAAILLPRLWGALT